MLVVEAPVVEQRPHLRVIGLLEVVLRLPRPACLKQRLEVLGRDLAAIGGFRNVLDDGCFFMLLVVGVIVVVDLATKGPGSLLH